MNKYKNIFSVSAVALSLIVGYKVYYNNDYNNNNENKKSLTEYKLRASWTSNHNPSVKWDFNWDKREPKYLLKPSKKHHSQSLPADEKQNVNNNNDNTQQSQSLPQILPDVVDDAELAKRTPKASRYLLLIRHGQYDMTKNTDRERILTNLGEKQAEFTGNRLKEFNFSYSKIINSDMSRAIQTSQIIQKFVPNVSVETDAMLREGAPIPPEPPVGRWLPEFHFFEDGGRIEAAFRKYFHRADPEQLQDSYEIIVCHANVIRYFICRALQFPPEAWLRFELAHASISFFKISPDGRVKCISIGSSDHIPYDKVSR